MIKPTTCLIIDDDPGSTAILRTLIKQHDHLELLAEAGGSTEGARLITKYKPGLIFLDLKMPGLNGYELLEVLEYLPKIIIVTGERKFKSEIFSPMISGYIYKPVGSKDTFQEEVDKALNRELTG
jgi:two-component system LytT family response regulator